jgi:site-specific DNA-methyltransferase (adenine-specific)
MMREWTSEDGRIRLINGDCVEFIRGLPDKCFELAVVDVPYGIGVYKSGVMGGGVLARQSTYRPTNWDNDAPTQDYWNQLFRVSVNQIAWGANHFISRIPIDSSCWIVWDKENGENNFADCELAWSSFDKAVRLFRYKWQGMLQADMKNKEQRIHPTQKPVALYRWLLHNYANEGDRILDTHGGSMSSVIACHEKGFAITCLELDPDYYDAGLARVQAAMRQQTLELGV